MKKIFFLLLFLSYITFPLYAETLKFIIDDFESDSLWLPMTKLGWWDMDDGRVYDYNISKKAFFMGKNSMKITYKKTKMYQLLSGYIDSTNPKRSFNRYNTLSIMVYGTVKILLKLEDRWNEQCNVGIKTCLETDKWVRLDFDYSKIKIDKNNIKNLFLFFAPNDICANGNVYLDDIYLWNKKDSDIKPLSLGKEILRIDKNNKKPDIKKVDKKIKEIKIVNPFNIAIDKNETVYVVQRLSGIIFKYNKYGEYINEIGRLGKSAGKLDNPLAIGFSSDSKFIYVVDNGNRRVQKFDKKGNLDLFFGEKGELVWKDFEKKSGFINIVDITIDDNGNIYILDKYDNTITKFDEKGTYIGKISSNFSTPGKIKFYKNHLYVLDKKACSIDKLTLEGKYIFSAKCINSNGRYFVPKDICFDPNNDSAYVLTDKEVVVLDRNWIYIGKSDFSVGSVPSAIKIIKTNTGKQLFYIADSKKDTVITKTISKIKESII